MGIFISFLLLLLNLVIIGVLYWGITEILAVIPFIPQPIKNVLLTILKVIVVIIAVIWVANWVMVVLANGAGFGVPVFIPYHRH
jgi:hypothetical protein